MKKKYGRYHRVMSISFLIPAAVMILIFTAIPLGWNVGLSFFEWNGNSAMKFVGLQNYLDIWNGPTIRITFQRSIKLALIMTAVAMLLGMVYAFLLYRLSQKKQAVFRFILFSPAMLPMTVIGVLFVFVLSSKGLLNGFLGLVGLESLQKAWLVDPKVSLWVIGIIAGWRQSGVIMMMVMAAMLSIPESLFESAKLEGAGYAVQIRTIILPLIKPTLRLLLSTTVLNGFKSYDIIYAMTEGGPGEFTYTASMKLIQMGFGYNRFGTAAAIGTVLIIVVTIFVVLARFLMRGETYEF